MTDELVERLCPPGSLSAWLDGRLPGSGSFAVERVTSGMSNELFRIGRSGRAWILRRPPRVKLSPSAHDVGREFRVLSAIGSTDVPHARAHLLCDDDDVIGAPFYVMDEVPGRALAKDLGPFDSTEGRRAVGFALVEALARLHRLDWDELGLGDFGRPDGYTARQVERWTGQLERYRIRELPDLDAAAAWLGANVPEMPRASLIHGDFGIHNVLFRPEPPAELLAIVDWETSTIGDPLADLGYFLGYWVDPGEDDFAELRLDGAPGAWPTRDELIGRYEELTGLDVAPTIDWYRALGQLKIAVILEGSYVRHVKGQADVPEFAEFEHRVPLLAAHARAISEAAAPT
ncbi:MAG: phosphotransferase family protein [Actinomycetota bacterium]